MLDLFLSPNDFYLVLTSECSKQTSVLRNEGSSLMFALFGSKAVRFGTEWSSRQRSGNVSEGEVNVESRLSAEITIDAVGNVLSFMKIQLTDSDFVPLQNVDSEDDLLPMECEEGIQRMNFLIGPENSSVTLEICSSENSNPCGTLESEDDVFAFVSTFGSDDASVEALRIFSEGVLPSRIELIRNCTRLGSNETEDGVLLADIQSRIVFSPLELTPNIFAHPDVPESAAGNSSASAFLVLEPGGKPRLQLTYSMQNATDGCIQLGEPSNQIISISIHSGNLDERGPEIFNFCLENTCPSALESDFEELIGLSVAEITSGSAQYVENIDVVEMVWNPSSFYIQISTFCSEAARSGSSLLRAQLTGLLNPTPDPLPPNNLATLTPEPTESPQPSSEPCFPASQRVELESGKLIRMDELQIGDSIRISDGSDSNAFSAVYFFGHRERTLSTGYVVLVIDLSRSIELLVSRDHFVYANGRLVSAGKVKVGDTMKLSDGSLQTVKFIRYENSIGMFSPHTLHGDLVVNSVIVSSFTRLCPPTVARMLLFPFRILFYLGWRDTNLKIFKYFDHSHPKLASIAKTLFIPFATQ